MEYQDGSSSSNYDPQSEAQYQDACYRPADYVFGGYQPHGLIYDSYRKIYLDPLTGQIFQPAGPYGVTPNGMSFYQGNFYDSFGNILSDLQVLTITNPQYLAAPVSSQPKKKIEITRPTQEAISAVSAINASSVAISEKLLSKASTSSSSTSSSSTSSSSWEADEIVDIPDESTQHNATNSVSFGVMSYEALRNECAKCLALSLKKEVESVHVVLASDRSSVCSVFYDRKAYIVDTYSGDVYDTLPEDFSIVGRAVLARDTITLSKDGKGLTYDGKIIVSHVLNARDENFTLNDVFKDGPCHLGSFHYHKEKGSGIVPEGKSYSVRGSVVDLNVGVVICGSYGWTPVSVQSKLAPKKDGSFIIRSHLEKTTVDNVFNVSEINAVPTGNKSDPRGAVTISPFIEGTLVRVYLSYGRLFVSSHSRIDISKSKYRDVFLSELFAQYGLTKEDLFPGDYLHSNFHYSFIIRDKALVSSSRVMIGSGSLAYLGVMYNYNSDEGYCPYTPSEVISTPVKIEEMTRIRNTPITADPRRLYEVPHIFVARPFASLQEANSHLEREFASDSSDCQGSVIVMQKDALGLYTNIVRVIHPVANNRMSFIEGQNDTEAFLKHIPDIYLDEGLFRAKYPLYAINVPYLAQKSETTSFEEFVNALSRSIKARYLTSENTLEFFRKAKTHYNINAVHKKEMRLRIIALTFVTCLPPSRQLDGVNVYTNYMRFLAKANDAFNQHRSFIEADSKEVVKTNKFGVKKKTRGPLYELNEKLKFLERRLGEGRKGKNISQGKNEKTAPQRKNERKEIRVDFRNLSIEDLIVYYRLYNKLMKRYKFVTEHIDPEDSI